MSDVQKSFDGRTPCARYEVTNASGLCMRCGFMDYQHFSALTRADLARICNVPLSVVPEVSFPSVQDPS